MRESLKQWCACRCCWNENNPSRIRCKTAQKIKRSTEIASHSRLLDISKHSTALRALCTNYSSHRILFLRCYCHCGFCKKKNKLTAKNKLFFNFFLITHNILQENQLLVHTSDGKCIRKITLDSRYENKKKIRIMSEGYICIICEIKKEIKKDVVKIFSTLYLQQ